MQNALRDMPAWAISLVVNLSLLMVFQFIVIQGPRMLDSTTITSVADHEERQDFVFDNAVAMDAIGTNGDSNSLAPSVSAATQLGDQDKPLEEKIEETLNPEIRPLLETSVVPQEGDLVAKVEVKGQTADVKGGVDGAMDRVTFEIRQSLRERQTLVVWVFDASGSLKTRREAIADRFDNIYRQVSNAGNTDGLHTLIWSYGKGAQSHTQLPIQDTAQLSEIVRKGIKEDTSGVENVFGTVKLAVDQVRLMGRKLGATNKLMFIVTDERGDDTEQYLEDAITMAKRTQTRVFTIGNAAVFGQKQGYVKWTYEDGFQENIPVDQGPECAFPDAVQLPYIGSGSDWQLRQMSSSYGPYALTRLCAETGGMYLITEDTQGMSFDRSVMRRYAPDYRPVPLLFKEIKSNAAKDALVEVASMTYTDSGLPRPELVFEGYNENLLKGAIFEAQKPAADVERAVNRMLGRLQLGVEGRESLTEPRWQAAFDLALGRLLAMKVRYYGYNKMLANMRVSTKPFEKESSNMWRLRPSEEILSGPDVRKASEMTLEYLNRVIDEHPGTPWAAMAMREKSTPLGWAWEEFHQDIPGMPGVNRVADEDVPRLLLAEEEEMKKQNGGKPAPKRDRPNL
ncbi:MAG: VWA domain-containing protein [Planctomycetaceae bacterium]|nr:VWA domain-containing protein [Planctomycetaceae bacterium]